ncbi:MAG: hypothetical protein HY363_01015 [Candidatus Aenigmarchaeota archaeon]|nr:hypothetical protein [Candidatus Aenigmarchaeota archaeon]
MNNTTTIQVSQELVKSLLIKKMYDKESYEDLIWDLLEDSKEINEQTKRDIEKSFAEIKAGKTISLEKIKTRYGLK